MILHFWNDVRNIQMRKDASVVISPARRKNFIQNVKISAKCARHYLAVGL